MRGAFAWFRSQRRRPALVLRQGCCTGGSDGPRYRPRDSLRQCYAGNKQGSFREHTPIDEDPPPPDQKAHVQELIVEKRPKRLKMDFVPGSPTGAARFRFVLNMSTPGCGGLPMRPYLEPARQDCVTDAIVGSMRSRPWARRGSVTCQEPPRCRGGSYAFRRQRAGQYP